MRKYNYSTILINWLVFLLSPVILILINSFTFFTLFDLNKPSGSFAGTKPLILNFIWNFGLLCLLNYLTTWIFSKKRLASLPISNYFLTSISAIIAILIITGSAVADITHYSVIGVVSISLPEIISIPWLFYLTYNTWRYQNRRILGLTVIIQMLYICLALNNFYSFVN
ncbi:hypothetical protein [Lentilactobacillus sunkii]|uniref:Uncharacterized protein n=1 Tax=Lentilactobacillus sunkii DSM 19904 TaxID=1423808 RepID=A0A0R1KXH7_9LACO|nr:hypothetical protein [Lentilactobacillus sunkii]KRK88283.1 hypothetical protein FD17_GL000425 [Lentilactobacillus sunkii DSM 19904]